MKVNGETKENASGTTLLSLVDALGHQSGRVVVELNGAIVPREDFAYTVLKDDDVLEIVCFVGGG